MCNRNLRKRGITCYLQQIVHGVRNLLVHLMINLELSQTSLVSRQLLLNDNHVDRMKSIYNTVGVVLGSVGGGAAPGRELATIYFSRRVYKH